MLNKLKRRFYFLVAAYFGFWAKRVLRRWQPYIMVITGSSGKTTTLHLVEAQLGDEAIYSHHANSSIGIPFHILGLTNITARSQWLGHALRAPFLSRRAVPQTKLYVIEADCDRPHEGAFLSQLLQPAVTIWISAYRTHSMNFDKLVHSGRFATHEEAIAYEFGHFAAHTTELVIAPDQAAITAQLKRVGPAVNVQRVSLDAVSKYSLEPRTTSFVIDGQKISLPGIHPKTVALNVQCVNALMEHLHKPLDTSYSRLVMPPGRSSVFAGRKQTTLIDSTYNTGLDATTALLELFQRYPAEHKWLILSDILEQGSVEQEEHERLAAAILEHPAERIILLGPRTRQYTLPILQQKKLNVVSFERPDEVLAYLEKELQGGETLLFKGARFLEGVVEQLLAEPKDAEQLVRRDAASVKRRQAWGLPH